MLWGVYIVYAGYAEEFSQEVEGRWLLVAQQVVERVDEVSAPGVEDMVEYFFVVCAYDLSY